MNKNHQRFSIILKQCLYKIFKHKPLFSQDHTNPAHNITEENTMKIGIGAIFRDEYDYIVEWLAWHKLAGFANFYIADNASSDGTLALLEALEQAGYIKLIYQPTVKAGTQVKAYERITQLATNYIDAILFIDADEFLCHESLQNGREAQHLEDLLNKKHVGAIGITWRVFGSSGHEAYDSRPVVERFTKYANNDKPQSRLIKSISKLNLIKNIDVHFTRIHEHYTYIDSTGSEIKDFIQHNNGIFEDTPVSGLRKTSCKSPLMINHYVIKSKQEFTEKKIKRGSAMKGAAHQRSMKFFENHDDNDLEFILPKEKLSNLKSHINLIVNDITTKTPFHRKLRGHIDSSTNQRITGWVVDTEGSSKNLKINIFLNGSYQGFTHAGFLRRDLQEKGISLDGKSGFQWTHPSPLKTGDIVEIKVNANNFVFSGPHTIEIS